MTASWPPPAPRPQFSKDFFFELMKDSQRLRASYLAERDRWLAQVAVDGREEVLFELEMLLRGVERYFNLHNLPLQQQDSVVARDFSDELRCTRDAASRIAVLARHLLDPPSDQRMVFRKYLESRVADDRLRRDLFEQELNQATPQESLFLLRSGFVALRGLLDALLKLPHCSYSLFCDIGHVALREIALNKYFKPLRPLEFRTEYDRIRSVHILEVVQSMMDLDVRRPVTLAFLALFRILHYLKYLTADGDLAYRRASVVLALVRSEFSALAGFLEEQAGGSLAAKAPEQAKAMAKVALALGKDSDRIFWRESTPAGEPDVPALCRLRDAFSHLCKQQIAALAAVFDPSLSERDLFDDLVSRREQAKRLRLDLCAYREVVQRMQKALSSPVASEAQPALDGVKRFVAYFRDVSYQLLRYGDYEHFDRFQGLISEMEPVPPAPVTRLRVEEDLRLFAAVLDKTFSAVCRREELAGYSFDEYEGQRLADSFVTV